MISIIKRLLLHRRIMFSAYALRQSEAARQAGCYSRAANYLTAMRSFISAVGDMPFDKLSKHVVNEYQTFLKDNGVSLNTISCYNRTLRAIYNKAVAEKLTKDNLPFENVYTGHTKTNKRSIREDCIRKIAKLKLDDDAQLERTRHYLLFSFYTMGMPFIDIAYLKKSQIRGKALDYDRRKTGQHIHVPLTDEALHIINMYAHDSSPYVFPILSATSEPDAYNEYCTKLNTYNRCLKRLANRANIAENLSSYTARHSWASIAYKSNVSLHVISQALGHANPRTTMTYIRELDNDTMREYNDRVQNLIKD